MNKSFIINVLFVRGLEPLKQTEKQCRNHTVNESILMMPLERAPQMHQTQQVTAKLFNSAHTNDLALSAKL